MVKMTKIAYRRLQIEQCLWSTSGINSLLPLFYSGITATAARNDKYITFSQSPSAGVLCLRIDSFTRHITSHVCAKEHRRLLCGSFRHKNIHILIGGILHMGHEIEFGISCIVYHFTIRHGQWRFRSAIRIKLQRRNLWFLRCTDVHGEHQCKWYCYKILHYCVKLIIRL